MEPTKEPKKGTGILWLKRSVAFAAVAVWLILIYTIFRGGGTMADQAPKCIFTTMIVFGILTAVYKGIEQWERKN